MIAAGSAAPNLIVARGSSSFGVGQPSAGPAYAFSFNTPQGMCPECEGIGKTVQLDLEKFLDRSK